MTAQVQPRVSAVLLDRDGVINEPVLDEISGRFESPYAAADVHLIAETVELIRALKSVGIPVAVVSNQPAAAKETHSLADLESVDAEIRKQLMDRDAAIDVWRYCFHHPDGSHPHLGVGCSCRKPAPGMLEDAMRTLGVKPDPNTWIIGDSDVDILAGRAIGLSTLLFEHPRTVHRRGTCTADFTAQSVDAVSNIIFSDAE